MTFSKTLLGTAVAAVIVTLSACSQQVSEQELLDRAQAALADGEIRAAEIDIRTALQQDPGNALARRLLGETYLQQQNPALASEEFARSLQAAEDPAVRLQYARALLGAGREQDLLSLHAQGDFASVADHPHYLTTRAQALGYDAEAWSRTAEEAQGLLDQALAAAPDDPYVTTTQALFQLRFGSDLEAARATLETTLEAHPDYADAWSLMGSLQQIAGDYDAAETHFAEAARLNPLRYQDRLNVVQMRIELGRMEDAQSELNRLLRLAPDDPNIRFLQGRLQMANREFEEALATFSRVLGLQPSHAGSLYLSASANIQEGNLASAQSQLNRFLAIQPGHVNARLLLANVHLQQNQVEAAQTIARDILQEDSQNYYALGMLAATLNSQGQHEESARVYQQMATLRPDAIDTRLALGTELLLAGDSLASIAELEAVRGLSPDSNDVRERLLEAHLQAGDLDSARSEAESYLAEESDSPRPYIMLGHIALRDNDIEVAREHFQQALAREPSNVTAYGALALIAMSENDLDQARAHYQSALSHRPDHLESLMNLAAVEAAREDIDAVRATLERAMAASPTALPPRMALARLEMMEGRSDRALTLLNEVRNQHEEMPAFWPLLIEAQMAAGDLLAATTEAQRFLDRRPDDIAALTTAARVAMNAGNFSEAEQHVATAMRLQPDNIPLTKLMTDVLLAQGKLDDAQAVLDGLPEEAASEPEVQVAMGRIALAQQRHTDAERHLRRAFDTAPQSLTVGWLSAALRGQSRSDDAVALLSAWMDQNPSDALILNQLASLYLQEGREQEARDSYLALTELAPGNVMVLNNLGWLLRKEDPQRALGFIEEASALAPDSPQVMDTYAMVQLERGEHGAALSLNQQALDVLPNNPDMRYHRALILQAAGREGEAVDILESLINQEGFASQAEARALLSELAE